jgi:penicillin V acylase-like amidase (Ntn superfamily)
MRVHEHHYRFSLLLSVHKRNKIPNGQSRETGSIEYTSYRQIKQQQNTMCVGQHYPQNNHN